MCCNAGGVWFRILSFKKKISQKFRIEPFLLRYKLENSTTMENPSHRSKCIRCTLYANPYQVSYSYELSINFK